MTSASPAPFFLPGARGPLFAVAHGLVDRPVEQSVLIIAPFAEEMNRSRRLMAEIGMALAEKGCGSLLIDLYGTGDSAGDFADARWTDWRRDLAAAYGWLAARANRPPRLLALRLGGLLALDSLRLLQPRPLHLDFLAAQLDGARAMRQFLRVKIAADMEMAARGGAKTESPETTLAGGKHVEVAGYALSPALYDDIRQLKPPEEMFDLNIALIDLGAMTPAWEKQRDRLEAAGARTALHRLEGPAVWQQMEPEDSLGLADRLAALIAEGRGDD